MKNQINRDYLGKKNYQCTQSYIFSRRTIIRNQQLYQQYYLLMSGKNLADLKISSLEFIVTPIQISLEAKKGQKFFVEYNKGAQILKKFDEEIIANSPKSLYLFKKGQFAKFKLTYERGCNCEWGLYKIINRDSYQFVDSLPISLLEYYHNFINSLNPLQKEYNKILLEKGQGKQVSKAWSALKSAALWEYSSIFAKNKANNIQICFRLQIRCELDNYCLMQKSSQISKSLQSSGSINAGQFENETSKKEQKKMSESITIEVSSPRQEEYSKIELPPPRMGIDFSCKRDSILSEILERSNQNQSNFNYGDKKEQLQSISGIPEEQSEVFSPQITNTKTINFQGIALRSTDSFFKRSNTYDSNFNATSNSLSQKWIKNKQTQVNEDEELGKQQLQEITQTSPQSRVKTQRPKEEKVNYNKIKWIVGVIIVVIISAFFAYKHLPNNKQIKNKPKVIEKQASKSKKAKQQKKKVKVKK